MCEKKYFDFSCKGNILLEDEQGLRVPMSEPYFRAERVAERTWMILSDGDYSYLLKGDDGDALMIDSGYGAGSIRRFCEDLIGCPVKRIANTHHHFDHTAGNGYFELAYMAAESVPLATVPFPSFDGIEFPRDYNVQIVEDGDTIPLKGRDLLVLKMPDHAVGSIVMVDKTDRILFCGDEIGMPFGKPVNTTVENWLRLMEKLMAHRQDFDLVFGGGGQVDPAVLDGITENCRAILNGAEGVPEANPPFNAWQQDDGQGHVVWKRRLPHPGDGPKSWNDDSAWKRKYGKAPTAIVYDIRRIRDEQLEKKG